MEECVVEHNYRAVNSDELTLEKGQKVKIISKQISDEGWWKGELKGKVGVFPNNFVKLLPGTVQVVTLSLSSFACAHLILLN